MKRDHQSNLASGPKTAGRPSGRRERRRAATREQIFRAALQLFARRGLQATTVEDITEAADVGKGTFFNYFPSKEHVAAAFGEMQMNKTGAVLEAAREGRQPLRQVMKRLALALAEEPGRSPAMVRSLLTAFLSSAAVRRLIRRNLARGLRLLASAIAAGQQRGEIRGDRKATELARYFMQGYFGALLFWTLYPGEELSVRLEAMFSLLWTGMEPRQAPEGKEALP